MDFRHQHLGPHVHAEIAETLLGLLAERGRVGRQDALAALDQDDDRLAGIDAPEITPEHVTLDLGQRAGELDARGPATHDHEVEIRLPRHRVGLHLGELEGEQDAPPHLERILDGLEPGREGRPVVAPEIGVVGPRGDDEPVVGECGAVGKRDPPGIHVNRHGVAQPHLGVSLTPEDRADGRGDVTGTECRRCHLVQHRLEEMVVVPIHHGHVHRGVRQPLGGVEAAESAAQDHDMRPGAHRPMVSRRQRAKFTTSSTGGTASSLA